MSVTKLDQFLWRQRIYLTIRRITYPTIAVCFFLLLLLQSWMTYESWNKRQDAQIARDEAQANRDTITRSQTLSPTQRSLFMTILLRQIPEKEDVFRIVSTIELLKKKMGTSFDVSSLPKIDPKITKHTIQISFTGDAATLQRFLSTYAFGTDRFITIDDIKVVYDVKNTIQTAATVTFYTAPVSRDTSHLQTFTPEHQKLLDEIRSQWDTELFQTGTTIPATTEGYDTNAPF